MKLEIFDAIGQVVSIRENLFGKRGHTDFKDNIIKKPYASYETDNDNKIGKYNFKITIYDLISKDSTSVEEQFPPAWSTCMTNQIQQVDYLPGPKTNLQTKKKRKKK